MNGLRVRVKAWRGRWLTVCQNCGATSTSDALGDACTQAANHHCTDMEGVAA